MAKRERRPLGGKVVAITGGARGIGKATAVALVSKGCRVAVGDLDLALAERTAAELGGGTIALPLDVTDRGSFTAFLDETESRLGPLDVLVNNAGIMPVTSFAEESDDSIRRQLDINVYGVIAGMQLALARMRPRNSGHIVNLASQAGRAPLPGIATYAGTKHAVMGLSEAVRAELHDSAIELTCVLPSVVNTELAAGLSQPLIKSVEPSEVADEIVDALELPRFEVFVPRVNFVILKVVSMLPRAAREAIGRLMRADKLMTEADLGARRAYEERAAHSEPTLEPQARPEPAKPEAARTAK